MAANSSLLMRVVAASVSVSNRASQIIRGVFKAGDLGIVEKGKNDLQTEADRSAQRCIIASLHKQFPKVAIFGEEDECMKNLGLVRRLSPFGPCNKLHTEYSPPTLDPSERIPEDMYEMGFSDEVLAHECPDYLKNIKDEEIVIWVDPLDGTAEYTQGLLDHVTCLIGIAVKGHAVAGVIHQPYYGYLDKENINNPNAKLGRCIWGIIGVGSYGFEREEIDKTKFIVTTSRSHSDRLVTETVEACEPTDVVRVGGAGHKVLLLIEGKVHAYVFASKGCKKWDTCAPEAVLAAVGGRLTDMHGKKMSYGADVPRKNTGGVLATVSDHDCVVCKIPEHVKEVFDNSPEAIDWPEYELARLQHIQNKCDDGDQGLKRKKTDTPDSGSTTGSDCNDSIKGHDESVKGSKSSSRCSDIVAEETANTKL